MKNFIILVRKSKFLSIIFSASVFSVGCILSWIIGFSDELTEIELILNPIAGGVIGYAAYKITKIKENLGKEKS